MRHIVLALALFVASPAFGAEPKTLYWEDLLPEGELERLDELYASQEVVPLFDHFSHSPMMDGGPMKQIGTFNVVEEFDGQLVRIPGFVLPFEFSASGEISEFLLVPYFGACIHVPPPPPNQLVYVTADAPADLSRQWEPIWAVGVLRTKSHMNDLGDAAYTLELQRWESYDG